MRTRAITVAAQYFYLQSILFENIFRCVYKFIYFRKLFYQRSILNSNRYWSTGKYDVVCILFCVLCGGARVNIHMCCWLDTYTQRPSFDPNIASHGDICRPYDITKTQSSRDHPSSKHTHLYVYLYYIFRLYITNRYSHQNSSDFIILFLKYFVCWKCPIFVSKVYMSL